MSWKEWHTATDGSVEMEYRTADRFLPRERHFGIELMSHLESLGPQMRPDVAPTPVAVNLQPTAAQRRLWLAADGNVRSATYNVPIALRLEGLLDRRSLERAIDFVVARHVPLHCRFRSVDAGLVVEVVKPQPVVRRIDLTDKSGGTRYHAIREWSQKEAAYVFDLQHEPPLRCLLLWLAEDQHLLMINVHHIVFDNWSLNVFFDEICQAYSEFRGGREPQLPQVDYREYALDAQLALDKPHTQELRDYWAQQFQDAPDLHAVPTDRPRPQEQRNVGALVHFNLNKEIAAAVYRVGHAAGATPYMTSIAAFAALLHRYSASPEIVIGSPFANRTTAAEQRVMGLFANLIPVRFHFEPEITFRELLTQTRSTVLDAFDNADLPFDEIVAAVRPTRSTNHTPVFQLLFDFLPGSVHKINLEGLVVTAELLDSGTSKYDLSLSLEETPSGLSGTLEYATDLFEPGTAVRLVGQFERLLHALLEAPDAPIGRAPCCPRRSWHR